MSRTQTETGRSRRRRPALIIDPIPDTTQEMKMEPKTQVDKTAANAPGAVDRA